MHLNYLEPVSYFSPPWITTGGQLQWLMALWPQHSLFTTVAGNIPCPQCLLLVISSTNIWEASHDQFCPWSLGRLIPTSDEDSIDRPFNAPITNPIYFGLGPVDNLKFSGLPLLLVCYDPGNVFLCCFFPYLELQYYNYFM